MASEIKVDTISEKTSAGGVTIDSVVHKDSAVYPSSADGGALGSASNEWSDLFLADSSVIKFGADQDTTLTHTDGTGLTLNSTNKLCFNDASQFVQGSSATVLSIGATDEIDLTATAVDLNGTLNVSGVATFQSTPVFPDGSLAVADLDIDGATDIGAAIVDADLFIVDDGAGGTNRKVTASRLKTYAGADFDTAITINDSGNDANFRVESNANANMLFVDGGADRVGVGTATPSVGDLHVRNTADRTLIYCEGTAASRGETAFIVQANATSGYDALYCKKSSDVTFLVEHDGDCQNDNNSYGATSDERIKQDITDANSQWDDIKALKVKNFKFKHNTASGSKIGVIAQDLESSGMNGLVKEHRPLSTHIKVDSVFGTLYEESDEIPENKRVGDVKTETETVKTVKYSVLYMKAIKALQEAQTRIETLEAKVAVLEG